MWNVSSLLGDASYIHRFVNVHMVEIRKYKSSDLHNIIVQELFLIIKGNKNKRCQDVFLYFLPANKTGKNITIIKIMNRSLGEKPEVQHINLKRRQDILHS